jgi:hypothetical protein
MSRDDNVRTNAVLAEVGVDGKLGFGFWSNATLGTTTLFPFDIVYT